MARLIHAYHSLYHGPFSPPYSLLVLLYVRRIYIYYIWWDQRFLSLFISSSGFVFLVEVFFFFSHLVHSLPIWTSFQCVYSATSWSLVATCTCWAWAENTHKLIRLDLFIYSFFRLAPFFTQITCKHCIVYMRVYSTVLFFAIVLSMIQLSTALRIFVATHLMHNICTRKSLSIFAQIRFQSMNIRKTGVIEHNKDLIIHSVSVIS